MRDIVLREIGKVLESLSTNEIIKLYEFLLSRKEKTDLMTLRQKSNQLRSEINHLETIYQNTRSSFQYRLAIKEKIDQLKNERQEIIKQINDKKNN